MKAKTMAAVAMTGHEASMSKSPAVACSDGPALKAAPIKAFKYIRNETTEAIHDKTIKT